MIKTDNVTFSYYEKRALTDVTWDVQKGEFWGIIGPNGSGKSTLLKCISKVLTNYEGEILIDSENLKSIPIKRLAQKMAFVPEESVVTFSFSCMEVVLMGRTPHQRRLDFEGKRDFDLARLCMEETKCWHLAERNIDELSSGEKQRVVIARALVQEPEILLLDEPTSHLDINYELEIFDLLKNLQKDKGLTIVTVLHNLNLAAQYCDKLILLKEGRIFSLGWERDVITKENIKVVYGVDAIVGKDPVTGKPWVFPRRIETVKT